METRLFHALNVYFLGSVKSAVILFSENIDRAASIVHDTFTIAHESILCYWRAKIKRRGLDVSLILIRKIQNRQWYQTVPF